MKTNNKYIIDCHSSDIITSNKFVGGKAWNLFHLKGCGIVVPKWFVITSKYFKKLHCHYYSEINQILYKTKFNNPEHVNTSANSIRDIIDNIEFGKSFCNQIQNKISECFGDNSLLAVRSSVIGEDSSENSFAGQMDSFLNVRPVQVFDMIKKVWASAFSSRALIYRHQKKIGFKDISSAVIIQQMIQSKVSGVLFSREPENFSKEIVIVAGYGLGEGVVNDNVETVTYKTKWYSKNLTGDINSKLSKKDLYFAKKSPDYHKYPILTHSQILQLHDIGIKLEEELNRPQDIEWAFDEQGKLFILQSRPIVIDANNPSKEILRIWDNSNIVESYPGLTLPLTFSFIRIGYQEIFRNATLGFLLFKRSMYSKLQIFENMLGLLDGRVYYNLLNWYQMLSLLPGFNSHKTSWDQMIGISKEIEFKKSTLSIINKTYAFLKMIWKLLSGAHNAKIFNRHFNSIYSEYKDINFVNQSEHSLMQTFDSLSGKMTAKWHLTLYNDFCAMKYYDWLKRLCKRWNLNQNVNLHNDLLCAQQDLESVDPIRALLKIVELVKQKKIFKDLIESNENITVWEEIQHLEIYRELKNALNTYLKKYGDRGTEELKLEKSTYRENPSSLIALIKNYYFSQLSLATLEKREIQIRKNAEKIMEEHISNPMKKLVFKFVLSHARQAIKNRENMRFARSRLFGIVRRLFKQLGVRFEEKGILCSENDIYYLTIDEVSDYIFGTAVTQDFKYLISLRKKEYDLFAQRNPEGRIETEGIPYLHNSSGQHFNTIHSKSLSGTGCSSGKITGRAKVVHDPQNFTTDSNDILVAKSTDPGWIFLMISCKGLIVEKGSILSHSAIIGREFGIPTIVGVKNATNLIPDEAKVTINGGTGEIRWQ